MFEKTRRKLKRMQVRRRRKLKAKKVFVDRQPSLSSRIGSIIDHTIYPFAPVLASKRMHLRRVNDFAEKQFERLAGRAHAGARNDPYRPWLTSRLSPDSALIEDLPELQARCADLYRSNSVASSAIEGRVANEIGVGLGCQPKARETPGYISKEQARQYNSEIGEIYTQWSRNRVDRSRAMTLPQFQKLVNRSFACFGEAFVRYVTAPYRGPIALALEIIPAEQIETPPEKASDPYCVMGIQKNKQGHIVGYWRRRNHPGDQHRRPEKGKTHEFIERYDKVTGLPNISHVFEPMFPGQTRGLPWLAQGNAMSRMKDVEDVFEAELINKQIETAYGVFIQGSEHTAPPLETAERNATRKVNSQRVEEIIPGGINYLEDGETPHVVDPSRPGNTFNPFIEAAVRSIAASLNYPFELLAKNFLRVTYSSGRLSMLDGRLGFRMRTSTLKDMFLCDLHEHVVYESFTTPGALTIAMDLISAYTRVSWLFLRHLWRGRERGLLDPEKENKGHGIGLDYEIESKTEILGERAIEIEDHEDILLNEGTLAIEREVALAKKRKEAEEAAGLQPGQSLPPEKSGGYDPNNEKNNEPDPEPVESAVE